MKNIVYKYDKSSNISVDVGLPILKSSTCKRKRHSSTSSESLNLLDSLPRSTLSSPQYKCSNSPNMMLMSISPLGSDVSEVSYMSQCSRLFINTLNIGPSERDFPDSPTIQSVKKARLM